MARVIQSLKIKFRRITIIPLAIFGIFSIVTFSLLIYTSIRDETSDGLHNLTHSLEKICELSADGDYHVVDDILYKGTQPFNESNSIVDDIKHISNVDVTIFYGDKRMLTTILNEDGERTIGTTAVSQVKHAVLELGEEFFSDQVQVNDVPYFGYYIPLYNHDGNVVGMLFAGKARTMVMQTIINYIALVSLLLITIIIIVTIASLAFSKKIITSLKMTKEFLGNITNGDVDAQIDPIVLKRNDEIGEMGRFSVLLQKSVAELVNTDPLTGLYNRRSSTLFLERALSDYQESRIPFTLVIGDIDDFKHINDTYGHCAGDDVLKQIAALFIEYEGRNGIVARWGGEEFLFVFRRMNEQQTVERLQLIQEKIQELGCVSENNHIQVTMTFGVCEYHADIDLDALLKKADDRLYDGKEHGKNQIVVSKEI